MFCTNCGNPIPDQARFCPKCGSVLEQAAAPPDSQPAPAPEPPAPEAPPAGPYPPQGGQFTPPPEQYPPQGGQFTPPPEQYPPQGGQFTPPPEQFPPQGGQFTSTPEQYPPQGGQFTPPPEQFPPQGGQFTPPPEQYPPQGGQFTPPPEQFPPQGGQFTPPPDFGGGAMAPKKKNKKAILLVSILSAVVVLLAAGGILAWRWIANNQAFDDYMAAGQEYMEQGEYAQAIGSFEDAAAHKPKNASAALSLAKAYLCTGQFNKAAETLSGLSLKEDDENYTAWERLTALASLSPTVDGVDASSFPAVTITLRLGSDLPLTTTDFTLIEGGEAREILSVDQDGRTVTITCRTEDTGVSEELRSLDLVLNVDDITFEDSMSYLTPYFEPAELSLVSTDVSAYPLVRAYFRVNNAYTGEHVSGLTANSFTVLESTGGEYLSRQIHSAVPLEGNVGLNIDLVADKSDSISLTDMAKIKNVMTEFVNDLHYSTGDKAELLAFDSIVQQMCYYTNDASLLRNGINNMSVDGLTAFYDAVYSGVTNAALQGGARCVIAFTDGMDNMSRYSASQVVSYANAKQVPVYIIGVGNSVDASTLRSMAQSTGGRYWHIDDLYDLQEIFNQIYSEQGELYVVEYESDASLDSYQGRTLSVQVSGGGCRGSAEVSFTPVRSIHDNGGVSSGSRYQLIPEALSWEEASQRCQEMGGHLATITTQDEMDLLTNMAADAGLKYIWLGGYTSHDEYGNVFGHWVTGEAFTYQAWSDGEPSRVDLDGADEWYIMLWNIESLGGWTWNDQRNDPGAVVVSMQKEMGFICEFEN